MELLQKSAGYLVEKGIDNGRREAEWIFCDVLTLTRMDLYTRFDMPMEEAQVQQLRARIVRRGKREPLAYILGTQPFAGLELTVGPGVLVPRPETEAIMDQVIADIPSADACVIDVGTGSGAIALAMQQARSMAQVEAVDCSEDALVIARANGQRLKLNVQFRHGDLLTGSTGPYDVVVANLPYIGTDEHADCGPELAFEPAVALFSGADGLDAIRVLLADVRRVLKPTGVVWLEHGWKQSPAVLALATANGLHAAMVSDDQGLARFARCTVA